MCYPKPGPRCSHHAIKRLEAAKKKALYSNPDAIEEYKTAVLEYMESPKGLEYLAKKHGEDSKYYKHFSEVRKSKLEQLKESQGEIEHQRDKFTLKDRMTYNPDDLLYKKNVQDSMDIDILNKERKIREEKQAQENRVHGMSSKEFKELKESLNNGPVFLDHERNPFHDTPENRIKLGQAESLNGRHVLLSAGENYLVYEHQAYLSQKQATEWSQSASLNGKDLEQAKEESNDGPVPIFSPYVVVTVNKEKVDRTNPELEVCLEKINKDKDNLRQLYKIRDEYRRRSNHNPETLEAVDTKIAEGQMSIITTAVELDFKSKPLQFEIDEDDFKVHEDINQIIF